MPRSAQARIIDRAASGAITFDAALETYLETGDAEDLLEAAAVVLGSDIPLDEEKVDIFALITGCPCAIEDYDDLDLAYQLPVHLYDKIQGLRR